MRTVWTPWDDLLLARSIWQTEGTKHEEDAKNWEISITVAARPSRCILAVSNYQSTPFVGRQGKIQPVELDWLFSYYVWCLRLAPLEMCAAATAAASSSPSSASSDVLWRLRQAVPQCEPSLLPSSRLVLPDRLSVDDRSASWSRAQSVQQALL